MLNTIQSVFLSETHVFVSISGLHKIGVFYTLKMAQKFVFPESGLGKFFHASKMRAIDSSTRIQNGFRRALQEDQSIEEPE